MINPNSFLMCLFTHNNITLQRTKQGKMTNNKLNDQLLKKLFSANESDILFALNEIQEKGNSAYIPSLIEILNTSENQAVKNNTTTILSELKHTDAVPVLIKYIEDEKYSSIQETLVRICWENGLDFTNYFSTFVDLLIKGDYMVAFEAYTVIESTEGTISATSAKELIGTLKEALPTATSERQTLIDHIINFLPEIIKA